MTLTYFTYDYYLTKSYTQSHKHHHNARTLSREIFQCEYCRPIYITKCRALTGADRNMYIHWQFGGCLIHVVCMRSPSNIFGEGARPRVKPVRAEDARGFRRSSTATCGRTARYMWERGASDCCQRPTEIWIEELCFWALRLLSGASRSLFTLNKYCSSSKQPTYDYGLRLWWIRRVFFGAFADVRYV